MFNPSFSDAVPGGGDLLGSIITNQADPQLGYMWEVRIETKERNIDYEKNIQLFARNCSLPQRSIEEMNRKYIGEEISDPGHSNEPRQFRATFWDDKRLIGYRYFTDWMNTLSDPVHGRQVKKNRVTRTVVIRLKDRSDFFLGVEIKLLHAYLFNIGDVSLSYDESIPLLFNVGIRYEEMVFNDVNYSLSSQNSGNTDMLSSISNTLTGGFNGE